jgi:hypothetical protein
MIQPEIMEIIPMEIIPRCSPSISPIVVDEICEFSSGKGMEFNPKRCKEM